MTIKQELDLILAKWDLLKHPFYQAWSARTLPVESLRLYAREYGAFVGTIPIGWKTLEDHNTFQEEQEHAALWADFTNAIGGTTGAPELPQTIELSRKAMNLFASPVSALGALYAFEAQQPATALSKLEGLKAHYDMPEVGAKYFELHVANLGESAKILEQIKSLSPTAQAEACMACESMAESLWSALTGIHESAMLGD